MKLEKFLTFSVLICSLEWLEVKSAECGDRIDSTNAWPWQVGLFSRAHEFFCSGSLISSKHVLSAASCFKSNIFSSELIEARLGKLDEIGSKKSLVWDIVIHPDWNADSNSCDADIAVVVLTDSIDAMATISPVCLPSASTEYPQFNGTVVGWDENKNSTNTNNTALYELKVAVISESQCFSEKPQLASNRTFCGGYNSDDEASLYSDGVLYSKESSKWEVRGIISTSFRGHITVSVYTNVAMFIEWIEKVMQERSKNVQRSARYEAEECFFSDSDSCTRIGIDEIDRHSRLAPQSGIIDEILMLEVHLSSFLPYGIGEVFPNLERFYYIDHNSKLTVLERSHFENMKNLKEILIRFAPVQFIEHDCLWDLPKLTHFGLKNAPLTHLSRDLFKNNPLVKWINFDDVKLKTIDVDFTTLRKLNYVNIYGVCLFYENTSVQTNIDSFQNQINRHCVEKL